MLKTAILFYIEGSGTLSGMLSVGFSDTGSESSTIPSSLDTSSSVVTGLSDTGFVSDSGFSSGIPESTSPKTSPVLVSTVGSSGGVVPTSGSSAGSTGSSGNTGINFVTSQACLGINFRTHIGIYPQTLGQTVCGNNTY